MPIVNDELLGSNSDGTEWPIAKVKLGCCDACGLDADVWAIDGSDHEYGPTMLCGACLRLMSMHLCRQGTNWGGIMGCVGE